MEGNDFGGCGKAWSVVFLRHKDLSGSEASPASCQLQNRSIDAIYQPRKLTDDTDPCAYQCVISQIAAVDRARMWHIQGTIWIRPTTAETSLSSQSYRNVSI